MKIICENKTIDLDKFESVQIKDEAFSKTNNHFIIATRHTDRGGIIEEEIMEMSSARGALELLEAITDSWVLHEDSFSIKKWASLQASIQAQIEEFLKDFKPLEVYLRHGRYVLRNNSKYSNILGDI